MSLIAIETSAIEAKEFVSSSSCDANATVIAPPVKKLRLSDKDEIISKLEEDVRIYEYTSAANPDMTGVPVRALDCSLHESGPSRVIPFDQSKELEVDYLATSPNLLASFIRICGGEQIETSANATSQAFFIIRGSGSSRSGDSEVFWSQGDLFVLPADAKVIHSADAELPNGAAIYWVHDEPLLTYLGVASKEKKFQPTLFRRERLLAEVERVSHQPGAEHRNRMGILLGNKITEKSTQTLTHTLWSLLNVLPPGDAQRPHRHNSVALDLCVHAEPGDKVYTLMGPELDEEGWVKNPIKCVWKTGSVFSTPPGWWHSHHNDTKSPAWVLPMQDAGLLTYTRTLDIRFSTGPGTIA